MRTKLKASVGHIWPAGRMLCMPALHSGPYTGKFTSANTVHKMMVQWTIERNANFSQSIFSDSRRRRRLFLAC